MMGFPLQSVSAGEVEDPLVVESTEKAVNLIRYMSTFEDKTTGFDIEQVRNLPSSEWIQQYGDVVSEGYTSSAFWLKTRLVGGKTLTESGQYILELDIAYLGYIDFYVVKNGIETVFKTGLARPYSSRPEPSEIIILPLQIRSDDEITLYLRVESEGSLFVPAKLYERTAFYQNRLKKTLLFGGFFSLCLVLGIYNLFLFFSTRDKSYLFYTLNNVMVCWFQASAHGFTIHYLWKDSLPRFAYLEPHLSLWLGFTTILLFAKSFLKLHRYHPNFNKVFIGQMTFCTLMAMTTIVSHDHRWIWSVFNIVSPVFVLTILTASIYSIVKGNYAARFFLVGWSFFLLSTLIATFYYQGLLVDNAFTLTMHKLSG